MDGMKRKKREEEGEGEIKREGKCLLMRVSGNTTRAVTKVDLIFN